MALNGFRFYDVNYLEYGNVQWSLCTNIVSATVDFVNDNRSDAGFLDFNGSNSGIAMTFSNEYFNCDTLFVLNTNAKTAGINVNTGTTYTALKSPTSLSSDYIRFTFSETAVHGIEVYFTGTTSTYVGEIVLTNEKFQLNCNPNEYVPKNNVLGSQNQLYNGRTSYARRDDVFSANMGWEYIEGNIDSMTGTDMANIYELMRNKTTFMFWPNAASADAPDVYGFRTIDMFKCRIFDSYYYQPSVNGRLDYASIGFDIREASNDY